VREFVLFLLPEARSDLTRIWFDIAQYSDRSADWIVDEVKRRMSVLTRFPQIGAPRDNLMAGVRMLAIRRYVVLYQIDDTLDEIRIIRILEGERDLTDLF
jgi:toxin ParE1/3/4